MLHRNGGVNGLGLAIGTWWLTVCLCAGLKYFAEQLVDATLEVEFLMEVHVIHFGTQALQKGIIEVRNGGFVVNAVFICVGANGSWQLWKVRVQRYIYVYMYAFFMHMLTSFDLVSDSVAMRRRFLGGKGQV